MSSLKLGAIRLRISKVFFKAASCLQSGTVIVQQPTATEKVEDRPEQEDNTMGLQSRPGLSVGVCCLARPLSEPTTCHRPIRQALAGHWEQVRAGLLSQGRRAARFIVLLYCWHAYRTCSNMMAEPAQCLDIALAFFRHPFQSSLGSVITLSKPSKLRKTMPTGVGDVP